MVMREEKFLKETIPQLFPNAVPHYLDFACGTGRITSVVENFSQHSYAVDVSESMQARARKRCKRTVFFLEDITKARLGIEPVQLATAFRFFGNAENELRLAALGAIRRQMASGGYLIINNHRNPSSINFRLSALRGAADPADLGPAKLEIMLRNAGFSIVKVFGLGWWFIHHRLNNKTICQSALVSLIDPISRLPNLYKYCPDYIVVAKAI